MRKALQNPGFEPLLDLHEHEGDIVRSAGATAPNGKPIFTIEQVIQQLTRSGTAWNGIGNKGGYDSAEFTAVISGLPSSCVAIQRYTNAAWTGFKRRMIGMGCSSDCHPSVRITSLLSRALRPLERSIDHVM